MLRGSAETWFTLLGCVRELGTFTFREQDVPFERLPVGGLPACADLPWPLRGPRATAFVGAPGPSRDCRDCSADRCPGRYIYPARVLLQRVAHELREELHPFDGLLVAGVVLGPVR